jgi:hypothetical protein
MIKRNSEFLVFTGLLVISAVALLSSTLNPFIKNMPGYDSSVFIYCAKQILGGKLIYKDVIDHKGPIIYLINIIGLKLFNGNTTGIWCIELISLTFTGYIMYKTIRMFCDEFISFLSVIMGISFLITVFEGGNFVEEWALPFISVSLYIFIRYLKTDNKPLTLTELCLLSLSFVLTFFMRANLVAVWAGFGLIVIIKLVNQKKHKELAKYAVTVILSLIVFITPIFLYFYSKGLLNDAYYWIFKFNAFEYSSFSIKSIGISLFYFIRQPFIGMLLPILIWFMFIFNKKSYLFYGYLLSYIISTYTCCIGNEYDHYYIVFVPLVMIAFAYFFNYIRNSSAIVHIKETILGLVVICSIYPGFSYIISIVQSDEARHNDNVAAQIVSKVDTYTVPGDKIVVVGNNCRIYLLSGRDCAIDYPFYVAHSSLLEKNYFHEIEEASPKLLIIKTQSKEFINDLLGRKYKILERGIGDYEIWGLK